MRQCNFDSIQLRFLLRFHDQNHIPQAHAYCPEYHHQPLLFTQQSQTPFRDMYIHKTPPTPPQNTYFPGLKLKVCKIYNYSDIVGRYVVGQKKINIKDFVPIHRKNDNEMHNSKLLNFCEQRHDDH